MNKKKKSHGMSLGLMIGAALGVTTGLFLQSKKGKEFVKDSEKKAQKLQAKILKELPDIEKMTKAKYEQMVDKLTDSFVKAKEITAKEAPEVKKILMKKWAGIEKGIKEHAAS